MKVAPLFFGILAMALSQQALAQTTYRCGNTFSQVPCEKNATAMPIPMPSKSAPQPPQGPKGRELCKAAVPRMLTLKDPYSAVVEVAETPRIAAITYANTPMMAKEYLVTVNAKNSYGGYVGAKPYFCYLSQNETNVLGVLENRL